MSLPLFPRRILTRSHTSLSPLSHVRSYASSSSSSNTTRPAPVTRFVPTRNSRNQIDVNKIKVKSSSEPKRSKGGGAGGAKPHVVQQKWSNLTLILLATAVGATTFTIGMSQGYKTGRNSVLVDSPDVAPPPSPPSSASASRSISIPTLPSSIGTLSSIVSSLLDTVHCDSAPPATTTKRQQSACHLSEMVQYHCRKRPDRIICAPLDRIFRMCPGRPAVEVTHLVEFDKHGRPFLPDEFAEAMPPSHHWHELRSSDP